MARPNDDNGTTEAHAPLRVQTGVRIEKRLLKVMKAVAEYHDMSLGSMLESLVLHSFEGRSPFGKKSLKRIRDLKKIYGVDYDAPELGARSTPGAPPSKRGDRDA